MPSGEYIENISSIQANRRNFLVCGIAIVSMLHDYSRQRRTIGSFSVTSSASSSRRYGNGHFTKSKCDMSCQCQRESWTPQRWPRDAPQAIRAYGCPENFRESLSIRPRPLFLKLVIYWTFVSIDPMNVRTKFEVRFWDNRGHFFLNGQSLDTPTLPFLENF